MGFHPSSTFDRPVTTAIRDADMERGLTSLFVYSNIVDTRFVGDTLAPLLRTVPVKGRRFEDVYIEFYSLEYHPVANFNGREIEIMLARDTGRTMQFATGKVIVNLHFRKVSN